MRILPSLSLALCSLLTAGAASAARGGEDLYTATCANCHGADGRGAAVAETGLPIRPLDFTDCRRTTAEADQDWQAVIAEGGPARGFNRLMPAFGELLDDDERHAVMVYVRGFCPDDKWPRGDLNFPRPLVTEKAFVEDEVVVSTAVAARAPRNVDNVLIYEQRFLRRQMFEVKVPFGIVRDDAGTRHAGIGDVAAGLKSVLVASYAHGSILSVGGEVILPTGNRDKGLGKGVVLLEPFLTFGQALPWESFVQAHVGAELPTQEADGVENEGFASAVLGTTFTSGRYGRAFSPMVEAFAARELASDAITVVDLVPQMQITLSRRQHIRACVGGRIPTVHREGRATQIMAYLLWDYIDGKLLEGW